MTDTEDAIKTVFIRMDQLRDEINEHYKHLANVDARLSAQERTTLQVMASIADHRTELRREMADLKSGLMQHVGEVLAVVQAIRKELTDTREKHERELIQVKERHDAVIDVVKADVATVKTEQAQKNGETKGGQDMAKWLVEALKVLVVGGAGAGSTWLAMGSPGV